MSKMGRPAHFGIKEKQVTDRRSGHPSHKTLCKPKSYIRRHLILEPVFHTTLPYSIVAIWKRGRGMASGLISRLEPWRSSCWPKEMVKNCEKSQFAAGYGCNIQFRYELRDTKSFILAWPLDEDPNANAYANAYIAHCETWNVLPQHKINLTKGYR